MHVMMDPSSMVVRWVGAISCIGSLYVIAIPTVASAGFIGSAGLLPPIMRHVHLQPSAITKDDRPRWSCPPGYFHPRYESNNSDNGELKELEELEDKIIQEKFDLDAFLDTPFFDPDQVLNDPTSNPLLQRFASFVQQDYDKAEAILAGSLLVILIILSQELLRMHIFGFENYVPFTKGVYPGHLF
jgi:hypothetical protein